MSDNVTAFPRPVRAAPAPLGLYLRPGRSDHRELSTVLLSGPQKIFGAVIDATLVDLHKELRERLAQKRLDIILDPRTQPAAFEHGFKPTLGALPWGSGGVQSPDDFRDLVGRQKIVRLAEFAVTHGFTAVLAPTHYLSSANDVWLGIDLDATRWLRQELDRRGGRHIEILYSLAMSSSLFRDKEQRHALVTALANAPINAVWVKADGLGSDLAPSALIRAMDGLSDFHQLGLPIIADHVGGVPGLSFLAFGSVGGIAHGVTTGETFDSTRWRKAQPPSKGGGGWRVYIPSLGMTVSQKEAKALFSVSTRARALFANRNIEACPRGVDDMLGQPVRAFVVQRGEEIAAIGATPPEIRVQQFLERNIRPMTDAALAATKLAWNADDPIGIKLGARLAKRRKRLDDWRIVLGGRAGLPGERSVALFPLMRTAREGGR